MNPFYKSVIFAFALALIGVGYIQAGSLMYSFGFSEGQKSVQPTNQIDTSWERMFDAAVGSRLRLNGTALDNASFTVNLSKGDHYEIQIYHQPQPEAAWTIYYPYEDNGRWACFPGKSDCNKTAPSMNTAWQNDIYYCSGKAIPVPQGAPDPCPPVKTWSCTHERSQMFFKDNPDAVIWLPDVSKGITIPPTIITTTSTSDGSGFSHCTEIK